MSRSRDLAAKVVFEALTIINENDGEMLGRYVINNIGERLNFNDWESHQYEKSGYIRWKSILHFFTIDCSKAGFLQKKNAIWYLTPEGEDALKLGPKGLLDEATWLYKEWRKANPKTKIEEKQLNDVEDSDIEENSDKLTLDQIEQLSIESIKHCIDLKNPYEFQDLVAALLRGMDYYTPFVAPKGRDGGIDIIAYRDPLGTMVPRIKVQVKHRKDSASAPEIQQLKGVLQQSGEVGMFISAGGFTSEAKKEARNSNVHVELIDLDRFISLWQDFYDKLNDEDKALLPLLPFYFHAELD